MPPQTELKTTTFSKKVKGRLSLMGENLVDFQMYKGVNSKRYPPTRGGKLKKRIFSLFTIFSTFTPDMKNFYPKKASKSTYQMSFFQLFSKFPLSPPICEFPKTKKRTLFFSQITPYMKIFFLEKSTKLTKKFRILEKSSKIENS